MDNKVVELRAQSADTPLLTGAKRAPAYWRVECNAGREGLVRVFADPGDAAKYAEAMATKHPGEAFDVFRWDASFRVTPQLSVTVPERGQ